MNLPKIPVPQTVEAAQTIWGVPLQPAGCPVCRQAHLVDIARLGQPCPNCGRGRLAPQPARMRSEPPERLVLFRVPRANLVSIFSHFVQNVWLKPDDFNPESLSQRAIPVFWPMWLVDSDMSGDWRAEMGYDYQVKSSRGSYVSGGWRTQEVVETRIRWEPRLGQLKRHYDNVAAPALSDQTRLLSLVHGYQIEQSIPYDKDKASGAVLRIPDLLPESAWPIAQGNLEKAAGAECQSAASAQHVRNYAIHAAFEGLNWTQLLLPVYISFYTDDAGQPQMVYVNGQSGAIGGIRLASQRKGWKWAGIIAAVAVITFILGMACALIGSVVPPLLALGVLMVIAAFAIGVAAIIPAAWPWQWNRGQVGTGVKVNENR